MGEIAGNLINSSYNTPSPVADPEKATDYTLKKFGDGNGLYTWIEDNSNGGGRSIDVLGYSTNLGTQVIIYPTHVSDAQKIRLVMMQDSSFILTYRNMCLRYTKTQGYDNFKTGSCSGDISDSTFDLYSKAEAKPQYLTQQIYKFADSDKKVSNNEVGPFINDIKGGDNDVIEIKFQDGEAITQARFGKTIDAKFGHKVINLKRNKDMYKDENSVHKKSSKDEHGLFKKSSDSDSSDSSDSKEKDLKKLKRKLHTYKENSKKDAKKSKKNSKNKGSKYDPVSSESTGNKEASTKSSETSSYAEPSLDLPNPDEKGTTYRRIKRRLSDTRSKNNLHEHGTKKENWPPKGYSV
ncbi:hypothetical protein GINT2_000418 [Glugoides intestinalis]